MTFLENFCYYNSAYTISPRFALWAGITAVASVVGNRVWIRYPGDNITRMHMYTALVGPPGCGKNTIINRTKECMRHVGHPYSGDRETAEALVKNVASRQVHYMDNGAERFHCPFLVIPGEMNDFFGVEPANLVEFLTACYDQDYYKKATKGAGTDEIPYPAITMLTGTIRMKLLTFMNRGVGDDFWRRCLAVIDDKAIRIAWPEVTDEHRAAKTDAFRLINDISMFTGEVKFDEEAKLKFKQDYYDTEVPDEGPLSGYMHNRHIHLIKLCLAFCANQMTHTITMAIYQKASQLLAETEKGIFALFSAVAKNPQAQCAMQILALASEWKSLREVHSHLFTSFDTRVIDEAINYLFGEGRLIKEDGMVVDKKTGALVQRVIARKDGVE